MGEVKVPIDAYYGAQTQRSVENFAIAQDINKMPKEIIRAFAYLKKAAALTNLDAGVLSGADAATDSRRNEITRAIGAGSEGQADYWMVPAEPGDRILVCSDGLSGEVPADRLRDILAEESDPEAAATRLIHEALLHGGRDNVTAVVVDAVHVAGYDDVYDTAPAGARQAEADGDTRPRAGTRGDV